MLDIIILLLALILDTIYPYHKGFLLKIHPVHTAFKLAFKLFKPYASKIYGTFIWMIIVSSHLLIYYIIYYILLKMHYIFATLFLAIVLKFSFSYKLLLDTLERIYEEFKSGNISGAKYYAQGLVRRNVYTLDKSKVISAAIESCAESLNDGFVSPLFYYAIFGPFGALFQRIVNTLDSALGYKYDRIKNLGWFSARIDDVINFIPARLTSIYLVLSAFILKYDWKSSLKIMIRDRKNLPSINAGYPISAISGALKIRLEKPDVYIVGKEFKEPEIEDLIKARNIAIVSMLLHILFVLLILIFM